MPLKGGFPVRRMSSIALVTALACLLADCANEDQARAESCKFTYDAKVRNTLVIPVLQKKEGKLALLYDLERPSISEENGKITLIFGQKTTDVLDTPNFIIMIDPCTRQVIKAGETTPNLITGVPPSQDNDN